MRPSAARGREKEYDEGTPEHRFMGALKSLPDPVPTLQRMLREHGGNEALFWNFSPRTKF